MAYVEINESKTTSHSLTVQLKGLDTAYSRADRICYWYADDTIVKTYKYLPARISESEEIELTGLLADHYYTISVNVVSDTVNVWPSSDSAWTDPEGSIVELWDWQSSNGGASAATTRAAYSAITSNGYTSNFSYLVWNDLVNKVLEIYNATGGSWSSAYATASATRMTSSNKTMTALRFNSLKYNIQRNVSTGISDKSAGDIVYGSYFVTLANKINVWINSL